MANAVPEIKIKKEIEDTPESPEQDSQDSAQTQSEASSQKSSKIWREEETRSLIALAKHYIPKCKDPSYTKRQLIEDISKELHLIGYETTAENVRNKMKYLRTRYKSVVDYNAKHVEKRTMPFSEELAELYGMDHLLEGQDLAEVNGNGDSDALYNAPKNTRPPKRVSKPVPASHVDLGSVVTSKKRNISPQKNSRAAVKRKATGKSRVQPLFQCGLCMEKFSTSFDMHGHNCKPPPKVTETNKKKINANSTSPPVFHWNSLITMHFLELLREFQLSSKNSSFRKGNIWENLSLLMKRRGHTVQPRELEKKFNVLTTAFDKTIKYNKTHKDKKKCAFFKRLTELYRHPQSFGCFKSEENVKMTVEVSPFSFANNREPGPITSSSVNASNQRKSVDTKPPHTPNGSSEIIQWLQSSWNEWKEMEKKKEELMAQRHNELMEMLSYLIDSSGENAR